MRVRGKTTKMLQLLDVILKDPSNKNYRNTTASINVVPPVAMSEITSGCREKKNKHQVASSKFTYSCTARPLSNPVTKEEKWFDCLQLHITTYTGCKIEAYTYVSYML